MSTIGNSEQWRTSLLDVYGLVQGAVRRAWPVCVDRIRSSPSLYAPRSPRQKAKRKLEDPITRDLVRRLKLDVTIRSRLHVVSQLELIEDCLDLDADPKGYLDIAILFFIAGNDCCLAVECKRLNVLMKSGRATLAAKYVEKGMMRFVTGQYSPELMVGAMIGYVMDGDVVVAHDSIVQQINRDPAKLLCDPSGILIHHYPDYFSTAHGRIPIGIELRHLLLSAN